jgi:dihydrofolate synthase/folylpolyglutamate synthase
MAFYFFAEEKVDIAVIETGMGGRLDSTNIIQPEVSLITNISYDHMQYLGDTLETIAGEKAGIIKANTPVVIGEKQDNTRAIFKNKAAELEAPLYFAEKFFKIENVRFSNGIMTVDIPTYYKDLVCGLGGFYQEKNIKGVLTVFELLNQKGWKLSEEAIRKGLEGVVTITGLKGRWYFLQQSPRILCDTAHNEAGIRYVVEQLKTLSYRELYIVLGMVKDKDVETILTLLPKNAWYFFSMPSLPRALPVELLYEKATAAGLKGETVPTIQEALQKAKLKATPEDLIFVGGSTFVVAEVI